MLLVDCQIPDRGGVCAPRPALRDCAMKEFVEPAPVFVNHQYVSVITVTGFWITFNQSVGGDGLRPGIALAGIQAEVNVHLGLRTRYDLVRDANGLMMKGPRAEIWMQSNRGANEVDDVGRIRV